MPVKPAHVEDEHREHLTFDELQRLAKTECPYPVQKDAFLFSCLTGMRWSDINKLTWAEVQEFEAARTSSSGRKNQRAGILRMAQPRPARVVLESGDYEAHHVPLRPPHVRRAAALARHGDLHRVETPRAPRTENDAGLCADYGCEETRSGESDSGIITIFMLWRTKC